MKKLSKFILVLFGFIIAIMASSSKANANAEFTLQETGSCVQTGDCGTTAGGVKLNGFWRETSY